MAKTVNGNYALGPFKLKLTGITVALAVVLMVAFLALNLMLIAFLLWVFITNFLLIAAGTFTGWNVFFILIASLYFIHLASRNSNDD